MTMPDDVARYLPTLLQEQFGAGVGAIRPLVGGEFSRAFAFDAGGRMWCA